ncbi:MFS transporter [Dactylosporangium sp. NPDC000244]|uniref:MFS transporter n=1 Tax=Dactylosporangium sp. NPDC000244 TaxID=3154365 RepID=UPI00332BBB1C
MKRQELKILGASAVGTAFEWYDFFLYGALVPIIGAKFFGQYGTAAQTVFALLTFAVGFVFRPVGALIFARLTDLIGRKVVFMITLVLMGVSTLLVGLLPTSEQIGVLAPILLLTCRILQGLAVSGEFGAAVTYVSEYAPRNQRGFFVGWLTGTTALALSLSLAVQIGVEAIVGSAAYSEWGWRVPFLISVVPLALSVWIRSKLDESPLFMQMKADGTRSKAPLREAFGSWQRVRMIAIVFVMASAQSFIGYLSTVYLLTTMKVNLKVDSFTVNCIFMGAMLFGFFLCVFASWLSDRVGRRPVLFAGLGLAALTVFPITSAITGATNPALEHARSNVTVVIHANPQDCSFQFDPTGTTKFTSDCDRARKVLQAYSVEFSRADVDGPTSVLVDQTEVAGGPTLEKDLVKAIGAAGYPIDGSATTIKVSSVLDYFSWPVVKVSLLLLVLVACAQLAQGPASVAMAEVFPTRIRATALAVPYQLGVGVFGGLLPATMVAIGSQSGSLTTALWYPVVAMGIGLVILLFTLPETKGVALSEVKLDEPDRAGNVPVTRH